MNLWYEPSKVPPDLRAGLEALAVEYPVAPQATPGATHVEFEQIEDPTALVIQTTADGLHVGYGTPTLAYRALGWLISISHIGTTPFRERLNFKTLGLMLDCSRNAVLRVEHVKKWLRRMALCGYNALMLYTEDTYALPDEPLFGFMRGAYTREEIQEIDRYAATLGIELIGCIQTLGHLEQVLKWGHTYGPVRDTASVILAEETQTYALIEKMVRFWGQAVRSRRIHIGQDEAHDLGRGRYLDRHGYRRAFDIFNDHLARVVEICQRYGLRPMIWSDMYFRMGSRSGDYYDLDAVIPPDVALAIPKDVQLAYWDYYHPDEAFYREWIKRHRALGFEPLMFSGIWTWGRMVYSHERTAQTVLPCVRACLKEGLSELFFTMWKDDGAEVDFDSALAGVVFAAEVTYGGGDIDQERWAKRFSGVCQADLAANLQICRLDLCPDITQKEVNARLLLWEDPLFMLYRRSLAAVSQFGNFRPAEYYRTLANDLAGYGESWAAGNLAFARQLANTIALKMELEDMLRGAVGPDGTPANHATLQQLVDTNIPKLIAAIRELWQMHRMVWMEQNKPFGFEVLCVRYGGLILRLEEIAARIQDLLNGKVERIEELAQPFEPLPEEFWSYRSVATASVIL